MMPSFLISAFADEAAVSLQQQIEALKKHGIGYLELRFVDGRPFAEATPAQAKEIRSRLQDAGIRISSMASPFGKVPIDAPFDAHMEWFRRGIELADTVAAGNMRLFSFYLPKGCDPSDYAQEVADRLGRMTEEAGKAGITCWLENEKNLFADTPGRCLALVRQIDQLHLIFDPANYLQCGIDPLKAYFYLEYLIDYIHVKDALKNGCTMPAGLGDCHLPEILSLFLKKKDRCVLALEPHLANFDGLSSLERGENTSLVLPQYGDTAEAFSVGAAHLFQLLDACGGPSAQKTAAGHAALQNRNNS